MQTARAEAKKWREALGNCFSFAVSCKLKFTLEICFLTLKLISKLKYLCLFAQPAIAAEKLKAKGIIKCKHRNKIG